MSNADPTGTIDDTPPLLRAARNAQDARIARVTAEARERDQRVIDELRDRAVALTTEILGVETDPDDWHPHRDPADVATTVPKLRGVLADVGGVTILADRDDRFQTALRPAMVDPDGVLIASRFPVTNLADLPERLEEVETTLAEVEAIIAQDAADVPFPAPDPAPTPDQTADQLFSLAAARRAADRGDVAATVLYLAGRVDLLASALLGIPDDAEPDPQS